MPGDAIVSECGAYRYFLRRFWSEDPALVWVMLNPSTADAVDDDATVRRCCSFSRARGFGGIEVVNLFALRSTLSSALIGNPDAVGPENDAILKRTLVGRTAVAAWGAHPLAQPRAAELVRSTPNVRWVCLGRTLSGAPRHPLYVPSGQPFLPYATTVPEWQTTQAERERRELWP